MLRAGSAQCLEEGLIAQFTSESFTGLLEQQGVTISFYNTERPHQSLDYRTPAEVSNSIPVEAANGGMVESLSPHTLRTAEPNLNIASILS